jgi:hypothetical protein
MKKKEINVPSEVMMEVAGFIADNDVMNEILGTTENEEVIIEVKYEKEDRETIFEMEEIIADWREENEED